MQRQPFAFLSLLGDFISVTAAAAVRHQGCRRSNPFALSGIFCSSFHAIFFLEYSLRLYGVILAANSSTACECGLCPANEDWEIIKRGTGMLFSYAAKAVRLIT
jgi:hypothetical protein